MAELLLEVVHSARKLVHYGWTDHILVHHRQVLACLLLELAACALAGARLGALRAVLHRRTDASLRELPRGLDKRTTWDPWRYILMNDFSNPRAFASEVDGREIEDDVGVLCRRRGAEVVKRFGASAIGIWLELWQLISN